MAKAKKPRSKKRSIWAAKKDGERVKKAVGALYTHTSKQIAAHRLVRRDYPLPDGAVWPLCIRALEHVLASEKTEEVTGLTEAEIGWVLDAAEGIRTRFEAVQETERKKKADAEAAKALAPKGPEITPADVEAAIP